MLHKRAAGSANGDEAATNLCMVGISRATRNRCPPRSLSCHTQCFGHWNARNPCRKDSENGRCMCMCMCMCMRKEEMEVISTDGSMCRALNAFCIRWERLAPSRALKRVSGGDAASLAAVSMSSAPPASAEATAGTCDAARSCVGHLLWSFVAACKWHVPTAGSVHAHVEDSQRQPLSCWQANAARGGCRMGSRLPPV